MTYNSAAHIEECLTAALAGAGGHALELVVVDNDSRDASIAAVRARWPFATVVEMGWNAGFSTAVNRGIAASTGRHVVLLNPDTVARPGSLAALVEFLDHTPSAGIVAPRLLNSDGSDQGTARALPTPAAAVFGRRSPLSRAFPDNRWSRRYLTGLHTPGEDPLEVQWVSGACLAMPRQVADNVGGLDEGFFMHFEDADLCARVADVGLGVWCVRAAEVIHHEGGSRGGWPPSQVRHFHHGAYRFFAKHHLRGWRRFLRPVAAGALAARALLIVVRDRIRSPQVSVEAAPVRLATTMDGG